MSPETATRINKVIKFLESPAVNIPLDASLGGSIGAFAGSLMYKDQYDRLQGIMASKDNAVNAKEYVAKYSPDLKTISTRADIDKSNLNFIEKWLLKRSVPEKDKDWDNAFYLPNKEESSVIVPKKVNKYILGHELGHHKDMKGEEPGFLYGDLLGALTGKTVDLERKAWEKSPVEIDEGGREIKDLALGSYENLQKYIRLGFGAGLAIGAARAFGPKVLEMIRNR